MRRLRLIPACLVILLSACQKQFVEIPEPVPGQTGRLVISLSADADNEIVDVKSSSEEEIPVDDFWIEIFTSEKTRIYCKKYAEAKNQAINLNEGDYRLLAKHGDTLGVGFDHAFYMAEKEFTVEARRDNTVQTVAKLSNVKAKVVFGEKISNANFFEDCYVLLKNPRVKTPLKFQKDETRPGYIPAGDLVLEVYAKVDGTWMYYPVPAKAYSPNDFVTFTVDAYERFGELTVTIKIDDTLEDVELETIEIPTHQAYPVNPPTITVRNFTSGKYTIVEDQKADPGLEMNINAEGSIKSIVIQAKSDAMSQLSSFDLMNLDNATGDKVEKAGFVWFTNKDKTLGVIDFEAVAAYIAKNMPYDKTKDVRTSSFTVTVTDAYDKTAVETVTIDWEVAAKSTVSAIDYNIWATKIVDPSVTFTKGNPEYSVLEYSQDGTEWDSLGGPVSISGSTAVFNTATGLEPGKACQFRVVYKGIYPRGEGSYTTEAAQQLGNAGFEEWETQDHSYKRSGSTRTRPWYRPWAKGATDTWWDVNSKKTLLTDVSTQYQEYKVVPTVYYSDDVMNGSGYSAQLLTTAVGTNANGSSITAWFGEGYTAAGELFIGKSDASGNHAEEGHAFSSRPASLSFSYKYQPCNDDIFFIDMYLLAADGEVIAKANSTDARNEGTFILPVNASSAWARTTDPLKFEYSVFNKKAAKIYICFRTSEKSDANVEYKTGQTIDVIGNTKGHVGSILWLDDLQLNY